MEKENKLTPHLARGGLAERLITEEIEMRVKQIDLDIDEISFRNEHGGYTYALVSHKTPVAAIISGPGGGDGAFRTSEKNDMDTVQHINRWLNGTGAIVKPQEFFGKLLEDVSKKAHLHSEMYQMF